MSKHASVGSAIIAPFTPTCKNKISRSLRRLFGHPKATEAPVAPPSDAKLAEMAFAVEDTLRLVDDLARIIAHPGEATAIQNDPIRQQHLAAVIQATGTRLNTAACEVGC